MNFPTIQLNQANPRFETGRLLATPGALDVLQRLQLDAVSLLIRHVSGNWGDVSPEDARANETAIKQGLRIMSVYVLPMGTEVSSESTAKLWVITEADRSATTLLLPEEY